MGREELTIGIRKSPMPHRSRLLSSFVFPILFAASLFGANVAADDQAQMAATPLADGIAAPVLDGKVMDEMWLKVEPYWKFTQTDPIEGAPASERTEVRMVFDKSNLYIGVICFDSEPGKIVVSQSRRDADLTETDAIIMVLDTFNDNQNAFVFGTNPLGIEPTAKCPAKGKRAGPSALRPDRAAPNAVRSVVQRELGWRLARQERITERGWETEIAIPFKTLRYPTGTDRTWGFNIKRNIRRKNEQVYLSPVRAGSTSIACRPPRS